MKKILVLVMSLVMLFAFSSMALASEQVKDFDSVLDMAKPVSKEEIQKIEAGEVIKDEVLSSKKINEIDTTAIDINIQKELKTLGLEVDKVQKLEVTKDVLNYTGEIYKKFIIDNEHYISVDSDNQIKTIYNAGEDIIAQSWEDDWVTTEEQYKKTGNDVLKMLNLDSEYELVKSEETSVDFWFLAYRKVLSNGLVNENEGFNLTVARANNSIAFLSVFNMPANTLKAEISEEQALENAQPIIEKLDGKVNNVELKYVQPNFFWTEGEFEPADFVRLAYRIKLNDDFYFIDVDAITGEVIGGDMAMSAAGAFGDPNLYQTRESVNYAIDGLRYLGYSVTSKVNDDYSMKNDVINFLQRSDAYAFYFHGHGSTSTIAVKDSSGTRVWNLQRSTIAGYGGNWNFVFLNCCSAGTSSWASAFNITSSSSNRAFMGWSDINYDTNIAQFSRVFWPKAGTGRIYDNAIATRNSLSNLDLPLYFTGDRTYWGEA